MEVNDNIRAAMERSPTVRTFVPTHPGQLDPPSRCPKCGGKSWERLSDNISFACNTCGWKLSDAKVPIAAPIRPVAASAETIPLFGTSGEVIEFFVPGQAVPGGSKRAFAATRKDGSVVCRKGTNIPIINVTEDSGKRNKVWRTAVGYHARSKMKSREPIAGSCEVCFTFQIRRPQAHYRTGGFAHLLRPDAPTRHNQTPDVLKLCRAVEDALTGIIYVDDSQTVKLTATKEWVGRDDYEGCNIRITVLP